MNEQDKPVQTLEALQLHYTSCRHGISGYAGFQVRAISEGIIPEEKSVLERLGMYEPPRNLPSEPSYEEIQGTFPKAFRSIFLETGKLVVVRSLYAGQDYTGRWGNYFAHALVFKDPVSDLWPVDLYEWQGWKNKLLAEEDNPEASTVLPSTAVQPDTGAYAFTELQDFLQEDSSRTGHLADMIRAVLLHKFTSRKLVIKEEMESVGLFWVACLQKSFSPAHQQELGCSTYQSDSRSCLAVNVTQHETDFILGETERLYQFYVFDFQENTFSEIPGQKDDYAETVAAWMSEAPDLVQEFHEFSRMFDRNALDGSLLSMLRLFQLQKGEKEALPQDELINVLQFVRLRSKSDTFEKVVCIITASAHSLMQSDDPASINELVIFLLSCLDTGTGKQYIGPICNILLRMFDYSLLQNDLAVYAQTVDLRVQVKQKILTIDQEFSSAFLKNEHLAIINGEISSRSDEILAAAMKELVVAVQTAEPSVNEYENAKITAFIENIASAKAPHLSTLSWLVELSLHDSFKTSRLFSVISRLKLDKDSRKNLSGLFAAILSDKEQEYRVAVINELKHEQSAWSLLYEDWRRCIDNKKRKKISTHSEYCQLILNDDSAYTRKAKVELAEELWEKLSEKERIEQALCWITQEEVHIFPRPFIQEIFSAASRNISFDPQDSFYDESARAFINQLRKLKIHEIPPRVKLRQAVRSAYTGNKAVFTERMLSELNKTLHQADEKTYKEFITSYLPKMLGRANGAGQHRKILRYIFLEKYSNFFQKIYASFFKEGSPEHVDPSFKAGLDFWLSFSSREKEHSLLLPVRECALNGLISGLSALKKKRYSELAEKMNTDRKLTPEAKKIWDDILVASEARRNSKIARVLNKIRRFIPGRMR